MQPVQTAHQNNSGTFNLIGSQAKNLEELVAPLRPYQYAFFKQCAELARIQRDAFPHVSRA